VLRFVQQDFARLQAYLQAYSLSPGLGSKAREDLLKRAHKSSLAALQVWAVVETQATGGALMLLGARVASDSIQYALLSECFSDLTSALFASLHGLYKPANMSLRSAIETFVRGAAGITSEEAATTTSVFRLFDLAEAQPFFRAADSRHFAALRNLYADLCLFAHSATPAHMAKTFALANYPRHDTLQFKEVVKRAEQTAQNILSLMVYGNHDLYLRVPPRARDLLDEVLPSTVRLAALGA
jgi:hypothetical protein